MKIQIGNYDVYAEGTLVSIPEEPIKFLIEDLTYELIFKDDIKIKDQKVEATEAENKKGVKLTFVNFNNAFGTSNAKPLLLGFIGNKDLFFNYRIHALNSGPSKTIHYTWLTKEKEVENG
jgi:hypothetical protein